MARKKWITKAEIKELLKIYSLRNEEFREVAEYSYMNKYIKGYMVSIQEEFAGHEKTGRILVLHTQQNGKKRSMTSGSVTHRGSFNSVSGIHGTARQST